jgi:phosphate/phosphite/phosphonate ABC transporter binding protein
MRILISSFLSLLFLFLYSAQPTDFHTKCEGASSTQKDQKTGAQINASLPKELHFGFTPFLPEDILRRELQPLMEYLSLNLGIPVHLVIAPDYEGLGALVKRAEVDIASFSPLAYVKAKKNNESLRLLLGQIVGGATTYTAYIVVHSDSGINRLEELKGKRFAFIDRSSASGYLFPYAFFLNHGIVPEKYFSQVIFAGNHLKAIHYVTERKVDAAATYSEGLMAARASGLGIRSLRIFEKTGRIPYDAVCVRGDLDPDLVQRLKSLLLNLDTRTEEGRGILGEIPRINGWIEVHDEQYASIREVLDCIERHAVLSSSTEMQ